MPRESAYQTKLIKRIKVLFPGCTVLKNDSSYTPGIADLTILYKDKWAMLEVKKSSTAKERPNQGYYIDKHNEASFASFIYPENEDEVLYGLQLAFGGRG